MIDIFEIPYVYNLRFLVAGKQKKTKQYIIDNYHAYHCKSVLDIGCGTGDFANLFSQEEYLGIDLNPTYIKYAKQKYPHRFICDDILTHSFNGHTFDASLFISTLHHFSNNDIRDIFPKITAVTKKIVIIVDLNPETSLLKKSFIQIDRGHYVRTTTQKVELLKPFGKAKNIKHFSTRLASQTGMIILPNHGKKE